MTCTIRRWSSSARKGNPIRNSRLRVRGLEARVAPAVFTVTNLGDTLTPGTLRQAVADANNNGAGLDTINFNIPAGGTITLGSELSVTGSVFIDGPSAFNITVSGNNATRLFNVANGSAVIDVTFDQLTLTKGSAADGGAIFSANENIVVQNCQVTSNNATGGDGGAIYINTSGTLAVHNSTLSGNTSSANGGAVYFFNGGSLNATFSYFAGNKSGGTGGGVYFFGSVSAGGFNLSNVTISGNTSTGHGGGVYLNNIAGTINISASTVANNSSSKDGGGLWADSGSFNIAASTISGNKGANSGGLYFTGNLGTSSIRNSTIANNTVSNNGGGIAFTNVTGTVNLSNSTISGNVANGANSGGFSMYLGSPTVNLESCIVAGNSALAAADFGSFTGTLNVKNSAYQTTLGAFNNQGGNIVGPFANLKLGALASNGGPTQTMRPAIDSPLLNAGSDPAQLPTDQRGFDRFADGMIDIGAVEFAKSAFVTTTNDAGFGSLRQAILSTNTDPGAGTITFDTLGVFLFAATITLTTGELAISDAVTINGTGFNKLTIDGNNASRIFNTETAANGTSITFDGMTMTKGKSTGEGGAINIGEEVVTIRDCVVSNSSAAADGGGINVQSTGGATLARLVLDSSTVSGNTASEGGGIYFYDGGSFLVRNSSIVNNKASGTGGGIYFFGPATAGGIELRQATISGNSSGSAGGGVVLLGASGTGTLLVHNSTIISNTGSTGGGIARSGGAFAIDVQSSIISGNTGIDPDISSSGAVTAKFSAIGSNTGFTLGGGSGNNLPFQPFANLKLGPLTQGLAAGHLTHSPGPDSPLVDAGSNPNALGDDQRNNFRTIGIQTDIGSVEVINTIVLNTNDAGPGSLRQTIQHTNSLSGPDTVTFDPTVFATAKTITLASTLSITEAVTITGPGARLVTISGNNNTVKLFTVLTPGTAQPVTFSGLTFFKGGTGEGGAINNQDEALTINDCVFDGNTAVYGGAIRVSGPPGSLTINRSTFVNNISGAESGGAISIASNVNLTIRNSTLLNNKAFGGPGGAIHAPSSIILVQNSTITGNTTNGSGGGIYTSTGTITIESSVVSGNVSNTTVNTAPDIRSNGTVNVNFSAIGSNDGFTLTGANNLSFGTNLKLGTLANNGGPTDTIAPLAGSPLINAGSNPASLTTDQRGSGFARSIGLTDIGAFELQPAAKVSSIVIGDGTAQRSMVTQLKVTFDSPVTFTGSPAAAFTLVRQSDSKAVNLNVVMDPTNTFATIAFTCGAVDNKSLADGRYTLTGLAAQFGAGGLDGNGNGIGGDDYVLASAATPNPPTNIFRLFGDANGDGTVAANDFIQFRLALGGNSPVFDFDNDGAVAASDFIQFRLRFGGSI